jgi:hypothetical protein
MSGENHRGSEHGGRKPGTVGLGESVPVDVGTIGLSTGVQAPFEAPANSIYSERKEYDRAHIIIYCEPSHVRSISVATIRQRKNANASAYVEISWSTNVLPQPAAKQNEPVVFQAYVYLRPSGPFLPSEVDNKTAKRRPPETGKTQPGDPETWPPARARLLEHENGHIRESFKDVVSFVDSDFAVFNKSNLTYEDFRKTVKGYDTSMPKLLEPSAKSWDDKDLLSLEGKMRELCIDMPIKHKDEK